jgi:surfactin synthase thioesterase subunit
MTEVLSGNWLVRRPAHGRTRARLFCFPFAGVGASAYRLWSAGLPAELEVCAVQLPGRENRWREAPHTRIDTLVAALLPELQSCLDLPFAFFGHSMGGILAAETTLALGGRPGPMPQHLFISARRAPHLLDPDPPLGGLSDPDFVAEINRRYGGIPPEVMQDEEMMALVLPGLRADIRALESYRLLPAARIGCPLIVFGGTEDSRASGAQLEAWRDVADGAFRTRMFSGDHFYINPRRAEVLADISATLAPMLRAESITESAQGGVQ